MEDTDQPPKHSWGNQPLLQEVLQGLPTEILSAGALGLACRMWVGAVP